MSASSSVNPETGGTDQSELVRASLHPHVAVRYIENVNIVSHNVQFHSYSALVVSGEATDPNAGRFGDDSGVDNSLGGKRGQSVVKCLFEQFAARFMHQLNQI